jgi:diguanylate cyclase (GGDEF)-like protein
MRLLAQRDDLAALARRVVAVGIAVCAPVLAASWFTLGRTDPWVRWGHPPMAATLLVFAWVLLRRPAWALRAAIACLIILESWFAVSAVAHVLQAASAEDAWVAIMPTPLLAVVVCLMIGFLFQSTPVAVAHGGAYAAVVTAAVATALAQHPDGEPYVWYALRYGVYLGVLLVLLLVLSRAKERVAAAVADADQAHARASRMQDMAYLDELTGIANRRRLLEELGHQARLVGPDHPVCVVYFDLDNFKQVNDTLGHGVGDRVLQVVAEVAGRVVRDGDLLARLGGEEFVLVVPDTDRAKAAQLAERLRQTLPDELAVAVGPRLTASFGVTELRADEDATSVLHRVDALMYRAKADGRDRVQSGDPAPSGPAASPVQSGEPSGAR